MLKIGLRAANLPTPEETSVLIAHIVQNYGGHTPSEIRLAFDMAINGSLEVEVNCYENFSCLYFSNIMNAYRSWAKQAHKFVIKEKPLIEDKREPTDAEMEDWIKGLKQANLAIELLPASLYDWLRDKARMWTQWDESGTVEDALMYRRGQLLKQLKDNASDRSLLKEYTEFKRMLEQGYFEGPEKTRIERIAKQLLVRDYLNAMK